MTVGKSVHLCKLPIDVLMVMKDNSWKSDITLYSCNVKLCCYILEGMASRNTSENIH